MLLRHYHDQTTNNFEKLLKQQDAKNTLMMAISIFLTIGMHIRRTRFLKIGLLNAKYDLEGRFCEEYTSANWDNNSKIEEAMAIDNNKDGNEENP